MKFLDDNGKELSFYREFERDGKSGIAALTLTIRDDADKGVAKERRDTIHRLFTGESGTLTSEHPETWLLTVTTPGGIISVIPQSETELGQVESSIPSNPPAGYSVVYAWDGDSLRIAAAEAKAGDPADEKRDDPAAESLEKLTDADLKTKLAEVGKYPKKFDRMAAINTLKQLQTAGA